MWLMTGAYGTILNLLVSHVDEEDEEEREEILRHAPTFEDCVDAIANRLSLREGRGRGPGIQIARHVGGGVTYEFYWHGAERTNNLGGGFFD